MKKIIIILMLALICAGLSCKQECKDVRFEYYTLDTVLIPELTVTERVCDVDLEMLEGTIQYFKVKRNGKWVLRCYTIY